MSKWTDKEVSLLESHFPTTPKKYIAEEILIDRSVGAIDRKATRLGLTKEENFYFKWKLRQEDTPERNKELENFIVGLTAGDGSFINAENGDRCKFTYKIEMNATENREMIREIKDFFECGRVSEYYREEYNRDVIRFVVESIPEIVVNIIPVFERNKIPAEYKRNQYETWKQDLLTYIKYSEDESCKILCEEVIENEC